MSARHSFGEILVACIATPPNPPLTQFSLRSRGDLRSQNGVVLGGGVVIGTLSNCRFNLQTVHFGGPKTANFEHLQYKIVNVLFRISVLREKQVFKRHRPKFSQTLSGQDARKCSQAKMLPNALRPGYSEKLPGQNAPKCSPAKILPNALLCRFWTTRSV